MKDNNTQPTMTEEAELAREMAVTCKVARDLFPDEALVQAYLISRFLRDPETFDTNKRLLQLVLRRPIQMQKPCTFAEFSAAVQRANEIGQSATILEFRAPTKH